MFRKRLFIDKLSGNIVETFNIKNPKNSEKKVKTVKKGQNHLKFR